jgi:hypothetical protein
LAHVAPQSPAPAAAADRRAARGLAVAERAVLLGLVAGMVALVLGHRYLPMNDAPSHTANAVIAADLWRGDPFFAEHYELQAIPLPYWAVALSLAPLQALLTPLLAFRLLVALYVVLLPLAFLALLRAADSPGEAESTGNGRNAAGADGGRHAGADGGRHAAGADGGRHSAGTDNRPLAARRTSFSASRWCCSRWPCSSVRDRCAPGGSSGSACWRRQCICATSTR